MKPLNYNVIVALPAAAEETTASGVIIGEVEKKDRGVVAGIGDKVVDIEVGDRVIFDPNAPQSVIEPVPRERYAVIDSRNLLAKIATDDD